MSIIFSFLTFSTIHLLTFIYKYFVRLKVQGNVMIKTTLHKRTPRLFFIFMLYILKRLNNFMNHLIMNVDANVIYQLEHLNRGKVSTEMFI